MSDPVIDKLARFTPTDRLDRDDLLFRAGRASAPDRRGWIALAGLLAVTQVATLAFWFTHPRSIEVVREVPMPAGDSPRPMPEPYSYGSLRATWDGDRLPEPTAEAARSESMTLRTVWSDPALK
jgi:hypothetical protein